MAIVAKDTPRTFTPCPAGTLQAVLCDVIDKGMQPGFAEPGKEPKLQHKVELRWQVNKINPETGKRFQVIRTYTLSLNEKAALRQHLEAWRGRGLTEGELAGIDLESEVGANCYLQVVHQVSAAKRTYAKVKGVLALPEGVLDIEPLDYVRGGQDAPATDEVPF